MGDNFYIIIAGCGNLGSKLSNKLSLDGNSVVVIDNRYSAFEKLTTEFSGFCLEGDATQISVLKRAKIGRADIFIALTNEDNVNILISQIANRIYKVPFVAAKIDDFEKGQIYRKLGIYVICPNELASELLNDSIFDQINKAKEAKS